VLRQLDWWLGALRPGTPTHNHEGFGLPLPLHPSQLCPKDPVATVAVRWSVTSLQSATAGGPWVVAAGMVVVVLAAGEAAVLPRRCLPPWLRCHLLPSMPQGVGGERERGVASLAQLCHLLRRDDRMER
jgi:hypothetical protein